MKKSNILLLVGFLAVLLFITAIHITLYAKYQSGDYINYNAEQDLAPQVLQSFPNIVFVSVSNVPAATVRFGDVAQVEKSDDNEGVEFVQKGDTLLITGTTQQQGFHDPVSFQLPQNATISVFNSALTFRAGKKATSANPIVNLIKSQAYFSGGKESFRFGQLRIVATDSSAAGFYGNTQVDNLDVLLSRSSLEYGDGEFGQLSLVTDSLSRLSLQSKHLLKTNIKTVATQ